ncbi:glycoside hydrolase family 3 N-terminal domain-containing protein [Arcobacter sp. CECT 8985]|uniref:glycoside hydrolase family 3 N-terminal domain-containing protein n=1 Tax=Arcobacter sp. CECT 8985 TaxID=1935424 RepID=UPI00100AC637|nr:glycoside hydrolase family 3 N-terminal domain-containing protein [Arcobacter sp. CECT 8985]RXJ86756.1 glycosyl hydrolase [Arcobacter sp. CECT 8985]
MKKLSIIIMFILVFLQSFAFANNSIDENTLKKMIGKMLIVGFNESKINEKSKIVKDIKKYNLGGVILFDRYYNNKDKIKNISSLKQLKELTTTLQNISKEPLIISIDQEGGKVARLKENIGFIKTLSAKDIASNSLENATITYDKLAKNLRDIGINCNFAPVVDLSIEPKNYVINQLHRSYGKNPIKVSKYAQTFISSLEKQKIISTLKHFPGHGSSTTDSHKGFVDVSNTWKEKELIPYKQILKNSNKSMMIMTAHVFNKNLDSKYPATLSKKVNTQLLRNKLNYKGVIISDDMQMKAISSHYSLEKSVVLAINSGVDILLFGNQLDYISTDKIINTIYKNIKNHNISIQKIVLANKRIDTLKSTIKTPSF